MRLSVHIVGAGCFLSFLIMGTPRSSRAEGETAKPAQGSPSIAEPGPAPLLSAEQLKASEQFFSQGQALYQQGKYQAAWLEFSSAYELSPLPDLAFNLAQCEVKMNRLKEAVAHYREFLRAKPDDKESGSIRDEVAWLERQINGILEPVPASPVPSEPQHRIPIAGAILGENALLFTIFGGVLVGLASSNFNALAATCKPNCSPELVQGGRSLSYAGDAMFGLAATAAVAAAIVIPFELGVFGRTKHSAPNVAMAFGPVSSGLAERRF
jgi:tetratricopeptide (TPR) repeat protein